MNCTKVTPMRGLCRLVQRGLATQESLSLRDFVAPEALRHPCPACGGAVQKKTETPKEPDFFKVYDEFMFECGEKNVWTEATFEKMRAMLDKYKDVPSKDGLAFPYHTNQAMNRDIKVLCRIAGIDQEERITTYRGNERIDEIKKKYELVGTIKASEMSKMNFMD